MFPGRNTMFPGRNTMTPGRNIVLERIQSCPPDYFGSPEHRYAAAGRNSRSATSPLRQVANRNTM